MEKFADRYCENNPGLFAKADTAYTLAYSVIMLNTDQHSAKIRHRMDLAAFIKNNRGINDNGNLPDELLTDIFNEINSNEIVMEEEQAEKFAALAVGWGADDLDNDRTRMELYRKEIALIQKKSQQLIRVFRFSLIIRLRYLVMGKKRIHPVGLCLLPQSMPTLRVLCLLWLPGH
jgi:brefeldin A-inhibited guanine nucleotide-exchange protein